MRSKKVLVSPSASIGKKFGQLTVLGFGSKDSSGKRRLVCRCNCGKTREMYSRGVRSGESVSCGCFRNSRPWPGSTGKRKHGYASSPAYKIYRGMLSRCHNPSRKDYYRYGGRGITVCERWRNSIEAFLSDMGERPAGYTLDRINNNGNYEPGNCRWATYSEQNLNKKKNLFLTAYGERLTAVEWAKRTGITYEAIQSRIRAGWSAERTLTQPLQKKKTKRASAEARL